MILHDDESLIEAAGALSSAFDTLCRLGLPHAWDVAEAETRFTRLLRDNGLDLTVPGVWSLWHLADIEVPYGGPQAAMKHAVDLHCSAPRDSRDPILFLYRALDSIRRALGPAIGMWAYLEAKAHELAAWHFARVPAGDPLRGLLLAHAWMPDGATDVSLGFGIALPPGRALEAFEDDGIGLFRLGQRLGGGPRYRQALSDNAECVAHGVEAGLRLLLEGGGDGCDIAPEAYVGLLRPTLSDRRWIDILVPRPRGRTVARQYQHDVGCPGTRLAALAGMRGWTRAGVERLLLAAALPGTSTAPFTSTALDAVEHVEKRDASFAICAALAVLAALRHRTDKVGCPDAARSMAHARRTIGRLRYGREILWLDGRLVMAGVEMGEAPGSRARDRCTHPDACEGIWQRVEANATVSRGVVEFLVVWADAAALDRFTPLIEDLLSAHCKTRFLLGLAQRGDARLNGRIARFLMPSPPQPYLVDRRGLWDRRR